jgi:hypothetical protein
VNSNLCFPVLLTGFCEMLHQPARFQGTPPESTRWWILLPLLLLHSAGLALADFLASILICPVAPSTSPRFCSSIACRA